MESSTTTTSNNNKRHTSKLTKNNNHKILSTTEKKLNNNNKQCFPYYELHTLFEPPALVVALHQQNMDDDDDDDDVGIVTSSSRMTSASTNRTNKNGDDDKIQKMIAKYLAEEDDEIIVNAVKGSINVNSNSNNYKSGNSKTNKKGRGIIYEKDERLSPMDRAFLSYTDRLKRSPKQVIRYAYDGIPLWSIPIITNNEYEQQKKQNQKQNQKKHNTATFGIQRTIPNCEKCGSVRVFEFQLLPSLLHTLDVDKYADSTNTTNTTNTINPTTTNHHEHEDKQVSITSLYQHGGMNWGNIAIYTCPNTMCCTTEDYCVIQDSVDEQPTERIQYHQNQQQQQMPNHSMDGAVVAANPDYTITANDMDNDDDDGEIDCVDEEYDMKMDGVVYVDDDDDDDW